MMEGMAARPIIDLPPSVDLPDLGTLVAGTSARRLATTTEVTTTFDTPDARLTARGVLLEHRSDGPAGGVFTLQVRGGPGPLRWDGTVTEVPVDAVRLLHGITSGQQPVAVRTSATTTHRTVLEDDGGRPVAEVVDRVVDEGAWRQRVVEVVGERAAVKELRRALRDLRAALPASHAAPPPARAAAAPTPDAPSSPVGRYVAGVIADGLDRLLAEDPRLRHDMQMEAVHQARVATRRLRSDLKTLREVLDPEWATQLREHLRWAGERLGAVRDADVLAERLRRRADKHPDLRGTAGLLAVISAQRDDAAAELRVALDSPRWLELLGALAAAAARPRLRGAPQSDLELEPAAAALPASARRSPPFDPSAPLEVALPHLVGRPWGRLRAQVRRLGDDPSDEALHQVRIRAKELRYAAEAAATVVPKAGRLAAGAKALQTVLGDHHDAVVAEGWLRAVAAATAEPEVAFAAGVLVGDERIDQAALRAAWPEAWRAVKSAPTGWLA